MEPSKQPPVASLSPVSEKPAAAAPPTPAASEGRKEVKGDLGTDSGELVHKGDLCVSGSICTGGKVTASGSISVGGTIESSLVKAGGDVSVDRDIVGRNKGQLFCGGSVRFRSANAMTIEAVADVIGSVELANSRIIAGGAIRCDTGHIYGGHLTANGDLSCETLGSPGETETIIEVGIDELLRRLSAVHSPVIEGNLKRVQRIRDQIQPLLANQRSLTAKQKESATELLYNASELETETDKLVQQLRSQVAASFTAAKREIKVTGKLYPGVIIRFLHAEVRIDRMIKGPVKLCAEGKGNATRVVLTDLESQEVSNIKSTPRTDSAVADLLRAIAPRKPNTAAAA